MQDCTFEGGRKDCEALCLSHRNEFLKPLRNLEHLRGYEAAGRVLLQTLTIFLREMINLNLYLSYYDKYKTAHTIGVS